jgi:nucleoid-associated protein YgaU
MANLAAVNSSPNVVMTAGGNLFQIAQEQYGDPTDWPAIAAANGLTDPFIQGLNTLTIPPQPGNSGGILDA